MPQRDSEIVIREVAPGVVIFSGPAKVLGILPVGGRSTAICLSGGRGVWVLALTPLSQETKAALDNLGPVKWIMAGNAHHNLFLGEYKSAYPDAQLIGMEELTELKGREGLQFNGAYGVDPPDTKYGFEDEIEAIYFSGFPHKDVAWYHRQTKTLIVCHLLFNLPGNEQYSKSKSSGKIPFIGALNRFISASGENISTMRQDAMAVLEWDFERIIMCHGDVIEKEAKKAWASANSKYLG